MSDARAPVLDKKMPFRLLRNIGVLYVPGINRDEKEDGPPTVSTEKAPEPSFIRQDKRSLNNICCVQARAHDVLVTV